MKRQPFVTGAWLAGMLACAAAMAAPQSATPRDIDKGNGRISTEAGQPYGGLSTVNGSITLAQGSRSKSVETVNGSITASDTVSSGNVSTVNGSIHFGRQARIDGDAETVNGSIFFDRGSQVRGSISTVNGSIGIVGSEIGHDIETVNGDITVGADSRVKGAVKVEKPQGNFGNWFGKQKIPRIVIGPNAVVEGPLVFEREVKLYIHATARTGSIKGATAIRYDGSAPPRD